MNDYLYEVARRLVAFDTVSAKSDRDAMEYIAAELAPRGFKTAIQPVELFVVSQANLVAWVGPPRADGLIISGHVDVVPFDGQPGWEREPLKLEAAGDKIYGRGTTDMKGFIAQCFEPNMIDEECTLRVSYRTLRDADPLHVYKEIQRRLAALDDHDYAGREHRAKIETAILNVVPPLDSPRGTALEAALFEVTGAKTSGGALYATDGGWFTGSGITSLICGPGDLEQAHQPNEHIRRDAFDRGPAMIPKVIDHLSFTA